MSMSKDHKRTNLESIPKLLDTEIAKKRHVLKELIITALNN